jgi:pullulanase
MVQALNNMGLRVVADVVYNHTNASGQNEKSVLDRIVPGYYHRLSASGASRRAPAARTRPPSTP